MRYVPFLFILLPLFFTACGPSYQYEKYYEFDDGTWAYADTLNFNFTIEDTLSIYNLYLELEHGTDFRNQNLYTLIHTRFPNGEAIKERLSLELIDKSTGSWRGNCGSKQCKVTIPIQEGAYFNQPGNYSILVEQYMRRDSVQGIFKLGFLLEDTGIER